MTKWEYHIVTGHGTDEQMSAAFNKLGADRWELVYFVSHFAKWQAIFKRHSFVEF